MTARVLAAAVALVAGCAAPAALPPSDPRVSVTPDAGVYAEGPVVVPGPSLRAAVRLVNPGPADRPVLHTTDWIGASGLPVRTSMSRPQRLVVPRFGDATIAVTAPTPAAVQFRVRVEPDLSGS